MSSSRRFDAVVIGGGHNGLVCAAYLAERGLAVCVLERRGVLGGAAVTEEFYPGFRNSTASYTVSLLHPKVIRDLKLAEHGLRVVLRPMSNFLPLPDGRHLLVGGGLAATQAEVAKFSRRDADALPAYYAMLDRVAGVLRDLLLATPPNVGGGLHALLDAWRVSHRFRALDVGGQRDVLDLFTKSAGDILDHWFESDPIKAAFGFDAVVGNFASPYTPGSAYVLLHHVFGEVNGQRGQWGHAIGGMGAITQAMAKECAARGVVLRTGANGARVIVKAGMRHRRRARGRRSRRGETRGRQRYTQAAVRTARRSRAPARRFPRAHRRLSLRLGHVPDERRTLRASRLHRIAREGRDAASRQRHHRRAVVGLHGARLLRCARRTAGRGSRSSSSLIPSVVDDSLAAARRRMSQASSASTCTRSCRK